MLILLYLYAEQWGIPTLLTLYQQLCRHVMYVQSIIAIIIVIAPVLRCKTVTAPCCSWYWMILKTCLSVSKPKRSVHPWRTFVSQQTNKNTSSPSQPLNNNFDTEAAQVHFLTAYQAWETQEAKEVRFTYVYVSRPRALTWWISHSTGSGSLFQQNMLPIMQRESYWQGVFSYMGKETHTHMHTQGSEVKNKIRAWRDRFV